MESVLVATFKDLASAQAGLKRIQELDALDDITIYSLALIHKTQGGTLELLNYEGPDAKGWPVKGTIVGALVGALGGPIGMVVGIMAGGITGSLNKVKLEEASQEFLQKIHPQLTPDSYTLAMNVEELDPLIINSYLQPYHGVVTRTVLSSMYTQENMKEWQALILDRGQPMKELEKAQRDGKAALQSKLQQVKAKRVKDIERWKRMASYFRTKLQHEIKKLDERIPAAEGKTKENLQAHRDPLEINLKKWEGQSIRASPKGK